ncbi:Ankyrin_repeat-containing protein [Hexamita inflata]|uniref:Ankyrin_repeat-containing protein n=1 Tax=Hexamita inflata TaxID=28002 RepID=A0ABP1GKP9_9EUKA
MSQCCSTIYEAILSNCESCLTSETTPYVLQDDIPPLQFAVQNNPKCVKHLSRFARIQSSRGWTGLMQAVDDQNLLALRFLAPLECNLQNDWGFTAQMMCCYSGYFAGLKILVQFEDCSLKDNTGLNSLLQAAKNGYCDCYYLIQNTIPQQITNQQRTINFKPQRSQKNEDDFGRTARFYGSFYENELKNEGENVKDAFGNGSEFYSGGEQTDLFGRTGTQFIGLVNGQVEVELW